MSDGFISVFTFSCKLGWINQSSVVKLPLDLDPVPKKIKATKNLPIKEEVKTEII